MPAPLENRRENSGSFRLLLAPTLLLPTHSLATEMSPPQEGLALPPCPREGYLAPSSQGGGGVSAVTSDPDTGHRALSGAEDTALIRTFLLGSQGSRVAAV